MICYFCGEYVMNDKATFMSKTGIVPIHGACSVKQYNPLGHVPLSFPKKIDYTSANLWHPPDMTIKQAFLQVD